MCTSISYTNQVHFFGRNLDLEIDYPISVVITPRNYEFKFRDTDDLKSHYAMIGVGIVEANYPLYFDGCNEKGLGMAGLAFFGMAQYNDVKEGKTNLASFEFMPYILGKCASVEEAKKELENINITKENFAPQMPASELHWIIADKTSAITVEITAEKGMVVYDNPYGVMTNCPDFEYQSTNLSYYVNLSGGLVPIRFAPDPVGLKEYSRGTGTIGLPGGTDSVSRFVRTAFTKMNSTLKKGIENETDYYNNVSEFFHILSNVQQVSGESEVKPGEYELTQYTDCIDTDHGILYYNTYFNPSINAVDMNKENLDGSEIIAYKGVKTFQTNWQN
ncbi:MAG: choloylglycine hydrolase family protein [Ileibacterium sp.]|nr:choloylglycine hydrolase family protein [Ileibacterium sp.]